MMKITDLREKRFRTTYTKDAHGNRIRGKEEYYARRTVRTVKNGPRFGHFIIDLLAFEVIITLIQYMVSLVELAFGSHSVPGITAIYVGSLFGLLLYPLMYFVSEHLWQRSPGKFLTKTLVIDEYGNKPDLRQLVLRSLIRLVPFEAFSCLGDTYSYGWHDRWSQTYVVTEEELERLKKLMHEQGKTANS